MLNPSPKSMRNFVRKVFIISKVVSERNKARDDIEDHLIRMKNSIIRLSLSYKEVNHLREKIDNLVNLEKRYAIYFKVEDDKIHELKKKIAELEHEIDFEKIDKIELVREYEERIDRLEHSLDRVKGEMRKMLMEKAKRHQRLTALEKKITAEVNMTEYFG